MVEFRKSWTLVLIAFLAGPATSFAVAEEEGEPLQVAATLGAVAELCREVGGNDVEVTALSDLGRDPHFVLPRPTIMQRLRDVDCLVEVGMQLEAWLQVAVDGAGNPKLQQGQPGRIVAARGVAPLQVPNQLTRAAGHVHAAGNPHIWLDPVRAIRMARTIQAGFALLRASAAERFAARTEDFGRRVWIALIGEGLVERLGVDRLQRLAERDVLQQYLERRDLADQVEGWMERARSLRGKEMVSHHATWPYLAQRLGMAVPIRLEEFPGIPPTARHLDRVVERMQEADIRLIVVANYYPRGPADTVARRTGARVVQLAPDLLHGEEGGYLGLIERTVQVWLGEGKD